MWRACDYNHTWRQWWHSWRRWCRRLMADRRWELPEVAIWAVTLALIRHDEVTRRPTPLSPQAGQTSGLAALLADKRNKGGLLLTAACKLLSLPYQQIGCGGLTHGEANHRQWCRNLKQHFWHFPLVARHALLAVSFDNLLARVP